jgi:hypothetical protein
MTFYGFTDTMASQWRNTPSCKFISWVDIVAEDLTSEIMDRNFTDFITTINIGDLRHQEMV